jgi:hypothetical protein
MQCWCEQLGTGWNSLQLVAAFAHCYASRGCAAVA